VRTLNRLEREKAVLWNKQQLQSVMMQGLLQGDSIPKLATRLSNTVGESDRKRAIRNARTMATGAQNAGRVNAYKRAEEDGVDLIQMWIATMDNRTRHSHRWLDGEERPVGESFSNGCEYPGDPKGDPAEVYNCRCSLRGVVKGLDRKSGKFRDDSAVGGMSYDEWRDAKEESRDILHQDKVAEAMRRKYTREYRGK
jgi:SPP1 gp7 family putative phage head morphogenesis protein